MAGKALRASIPNSRRLTPINIALKEPDTVTAVISPQGEIGIYIAKIPEGLTAIIDTVEINGDEVTYPPFEGPYSVTPAVGEQVLDTQYKSMRYDTTVEAIPYVQAENEAKGYTVSIAS